MKRSTLNLVFAVLYGLLALLLVGAIVLTSSCNSNCPKSYSHTVMIDITEPIAEWPTANELLALYKLDSNSNNSVEIRAQFLTDLTINPEVILKLTSGGARLTTNQFSRKNEIELFNQSVVDLIDSLKTDSLVGRENSSLYVPIITQLNRLSESTADEKILTVYSDLMEHSSNANFYDPKTLHLILFSPDSLVRRLSTVLPIADLKNITVYFVYQPTTVEEDVDFVIVSKFWKQMLEAHGANVKITGRLNN